MSSSFDGTNSGTQVGTNQGVINILSDQPEHTQQRTDHEVLCSLAFPQMLDRRDNIEPCHTNTCQWILELEKYKSWRSQSYGLLWIKGKPGAGKSTLMAFLHEKLENLQDGRQGIRLDFFFSARGTEMQRSPLGMFRSLLNQIFDRDTTVRPQVREIYERRCRQLGYGESKWEWPRSVLEGLLTGAVLTSADRQPVTIFVDALDEAGAESAQQLATYFHRLIDLAGTKKAAVQICISCRHYPIMGNAQTIEITVEDHNRGDISTYIEDILAGTELGDGPDQEAKEDLLWQLIQQANGVFQWAYLMMPLVKRRIIEGEPLDDIRCWLREIPAGLEDVYTYILNEVIEDRNREESFLLFQWICFAERPLTVTEMRYALAASNARMITGAPRRLENVDVFVESNERMKRRIKTLSGGLTEVVLNGHHDEIVQVVHQSVNDFLRSKGLRIFHHYVTGDKSPTDGDMVLLQCQATLYRSCMVYLATTNLPQEIPQGILKASEDLNRDLPFLDYATINLFIHAERAASCRASAVKNELDMLQRVMGRWVQSYRILGWLDTACPEQGTTVLHIAAASNLVDLIDCILSNGEDVATEDKKGKTALHLAARGGHIPAGKVLLEKGADQEARCIEGMTPLIEAASRGNVAFVEWLLYEGASLGSKMDEEEGALQAAAARGHQSVVDILIGAGANVNAQSGRYGTALQAAASEGSVEIVRMLLHAKADVNAQGGEYGNALQAAAYKGSTRMVRMLLDAQANVNAQGGRYGNALQAAALNGHTKILRMLLDAQADVNAQGGVCGSGLSAAIHGNHPEEVQSLLDAGADVLLADELGQTPLHIASLKDNLNVLLRFPLLASTVNTRDKLSRTPLHLAVHLGHIDLASRLLDLGADPSIRDGYGRNIMDWAQGNQSLMDQISDHCPAISLTPADFQNWSLRHSVIQISQILLSSRLDSPSPFLRQLGRYFLSLDELDNARYLFQLYLSQAKFRISNIPEIPCDICGIEIYMSHFVCKICAQIDLCLFCVQKHTRSHPDQRHESFKVPKLSDDELKLTGLSSEHFRSFLRNLVREFPAPNPDEMEMNPSHDSAPYPPLKRTRLV